MKTLVIGFHEQLDEKYEMQFCKEACLDLQEQQVDWLSVTSVSSIQQEENLIEYDRIIFAFALVNYTTPSLLNAWCEVNFADPLQWQNTEIGCIVFTNEAEIEFRAGQAIGASVDQLLLPLQIWANQYSYYLMPYVVYQWFQMEETEKQACLIELEQYMTLAHFDDIHEQAHWYIDQLTTVFGEDELALNLKEIISDNEFQLSTMNWM